MNKEDQILRQLEYIRRLSETNATNMGNGLMLIQTYYQTICYCPAEDTVITPKLVTSRYWEKYISNYLVDTLTPDTCFVDVGAHIGYFSSLAAVHIGLEGSGQVFAFEPSPHLLPLLRKNLFVNGATCPWEVHPFAIGENDGETAFYATIDRSAHGSLHPESKAALASEHTVPCRKLDSAVPVDLHERIDIIKIDVEGHEYEVLQGMQQILQANVHLKVILEWSPRQMLKAGHDLKVVANLLKDNFCRVSVFRRSLEPVNFDSLPDLDLADLLLEK